jgi:hypothetical protein
VGEGLLSLVSVPEPAPNQGLEPTASSVRFRQRLRLGVRFRSSHYWLAQQRVASQFEL